MAKIELDTAYRIRSVIESLPEVSPKTFDIRDVISWLEAYGVEVEGGTQDG